MSMVNNNMDRTLSPPFRFGMVCPGIYRGAYPTLPNFRCLSRLALTHIISLTPEAPINDLISFCDVIGIKNHHIQINRMAPTNNVLIASLQSAIYILLDITTTDNNNGTS